VLLDVVPVVGFHVALFATEVSGVHVEDVVDAANGSYARLCHKYQTLHSKVGLSQNALA